MNTNNTFSSIMLICLLFGTSGTAMADDSTCPGGTVQYAVILGNLIVADVSCIVKYTTIRGDVIVDNTGENNAIFVIENSIVQGGVVIKGGNVVIDKSTILSKSLSVFDSQDALISHNKVLSGNMIFDANMGMLIYENVVAFGDIQCLDNSKIQINYFATGNLVPLGHITCFGQ